jgi:hypothetical protein
LKIFISYKLDGFKTIVELHKLSQERCIFGGKIYATSKTVKQIELLAFQASGEPKNWEKEYTSDHDGAFECHFKTFYNTKDLGHSMCPEYRA